MNKSLLIILLTGICSICTAKEKPTLLQQADSAYAKEDYEQACNLYRQVAKSSDNADVYYNLGNCYYRLDELAEAILWYERASLLNPSDDDVQFNLDLARSKTVDKIVPQHSLFFVEWYSSMVQMMNQNQWAGTCIFLLVLTLGAVLVYLFTDPLWLRKTGFSVAVVGVLLLVVCNLCGYSQRRTLLNRTGAIVMQPAVTVKSTPNKGGKDLFVIHDGTRVDITDDTLDGWYEIRLADGKVGWIPSKQAERI